MLALELLTLLDCSRDCRAGRAVEMVEQMAQRLAAVRHRQRKALQAAVQVEHIQVERAVVVQVWLVRPQQITMQLMAALDCQVL